MRKEEERGRYAAWEKRVCDWRTLGKFACKGWKGKLQTMAQILASYGYGMGHLPVQHLGKNAWESFGLVRRMKLPGGSGRCLCQSSGWRHGIISAMQHSLHAAPLERKALDRIHRPEN